MSITWAFWSIVFCGLLLIDLESVQAIWFPWYFHRYGLEPHSARHYGAKSKKTTLAPTHQVTKGVTCPPGYELKGAMGTTQKGASAGFRTCDDNPVLMQLARLYAISPERVVLLLAQPSLIDSCGEIADVLSRIKTATTNCVFAEDNIYGKLSDALDYFQSEVCDGGDGSNRKRCTDLTQAHSCLKELRTDMIECEAPADWYEKRNATKVCQIFNDVLDCYYTRAAMLCGLDSAKQLRSFAGDTMGRAMIHSCVVNKRLPRVDDAMPSQGERSWSKPFIMLTFCLVYIYFS